MRAPIRKIVFGAILACFGFGSSVGAVRNRNPQRDPQDQRYTVKAARRVIRLVDADGRPMEGAIASTYFQRDCDREASFSVPESIEGATSNSRGLAALELRIPRQLDGVGIYAIRPAEGRPLVGLCKVTREMLDKPISVVMYPACRVHFRIDSTGLAGLEKKYHAELVGEGWWRAAYVVLGASSEGRPRPLFASSTNGELEFFLPPGHVTIHAYGPDVKWEDRPIEIKLGDRDKSVGVFDLAASADAENGRFPGHHRVRQDAARGGGPSFRRIRYLPLRDIGREVQDVAFSPLGKLVAAARYTKNGPGEVVLWDTVSCKKVATLPVADRGVESVAFSPDGKLLAGRVHMLDDQDGPSEVMLWEVASRRAVLTIGVPAVNIVAVAFSPDSQTLATSGSDRTVRVWDVGSGREIRLIDGVGGGALAFSPSGQMLVMIGGGGSLTFWDVAANRRRLTPELETEAFRVRSIAFSPDGRTLAAGGAMNDGKNGNEHGHVRLYDVAREPFRRCAVLTFDGDAHAPGGANRQDQVPFCSDVKFTPDGRRVVAVGALKIRTWNASTGAETDAFERSSGGSSDGLAVSPDGRWMAVTSPVGAGVNIFDIVAP